MFCKTKAGTDITVMMYSIVQTAINNGIHAERYIKYVLENIDKTKNIRTKNKNPDVSRGRNPEEETHMEKFNAYIKTNVLPLTGGRLEI